MLNDTLLAQVTCIESLTPRVKRFTLSAAAGENRLPAFSAGAHITTFLNVGAHMLERNYSLCNAPTYGGVYQIAVSLSELSQGGSVYWHQQIQIGDLVHISPPKNHFPLSRRAAHHIFLAAGIGITPFMSMMAELDASHRTYELHYAAKSRYECAFYADISVQHRNSCFYFSEEHHRLSVDVLRNRRVGTHVYICGPSSFMESYAQAAASIGFPKQNIHMEKFTAPTPINPHPFRVMLQKSGRVITVEAHETLLAALIRCGVRVRYACRAGGCGTCEIGLVGGRAEHRDDYLTEEEKTANKSIISCVSRGEDDLVLDL